MLRHRFDSVALAPKMKAPLLCIVASDDDIIPPEPRSACSTVLWYAEAWSRRSTAWSRSASGTTRILPVNWLLKHRFDSAALAPKMKTPLLCIVATHDEIIPAEHARRLYEAWGGPKRWIGLEGAGHNSTDNAANYWPSIARFLTEKPS